MPIRYCTSVIHLFTGGSSPIIVHQRHRRTGSDASQKRHMFAETFRAEHQNQPKLIMSSSRKDKTTPNIPSSKQNVSVLAAGKQISSTPLIGADLQLANLGADRLHNGGDKLVRKSSTGSDIVSRTPSNGSDKIILRPGPGSDILSRTPSDCSDKVILRPSNGMSGTVGGGEYVSSSSAAGGGYTPPPPWNVSEIEITEALSRRTDLSQTEEEREEAQGGEREDNKDGEREENKDAEGNTRKSGGEQKETSRVVEPETENANG